MAPQIDKLRPNDPRIKKQYTTVNGHKWAYLHAVPEPPLKGTIVLIHGFPDISFAWRNQIPLFLSLGFQCVALDSMGYSDTGASPRLEDYSFKSHADAVKGICDALHVDRIIIGGHDWGGITVYRVAQWYPELVTHVFSVCTAYVPPSEKYFSAEWLAKTKIPQFGYQLQFGSEDRKVEKVVKDEASMRKFLKGMYGGKVSSGKRFMTPEHGVDLSIIETDEVGPSKLFNEEEFDFYVKEFMKNGIHGPLNWYRLRQINWEEEKRMPAEVKKIIKQPTLYIFATKDEVLTKDLAAGMQRTVPNLTYGEVPAGHWALWQTPHETNKLLKDWLQDVVLGGRSKL